MLCGGGELWRCGWRQVLYEGIRDFSLVLVRQSLTSSEGVIVKGLGIMDFLWFLSGNH